MKNWMRKQAMLFYFFFLAIKAFKFVLDIHCNFVWKMMVFLSSWFLKIEPYKVMMTELNLKYINSKTYYVFELNDIW